MTIKIWRVSLPGAGDEFFDHMISIVTTENSAAYAVPKINGEPLYHFEQKRIVLTGCTSYKGTKGRSFPNTWKFSGILNTRQNYAP